MSERLPYSGTPLPAGLPGVGGSSIEVLILPGFNTVVASQTFGPTVDAPEAVPPSPIPPEGSNPNNPTTTPISPGVVSNNATYPNFCKECENQDDVGLTPLMYGTRYEDKCTDCDNKVKDVTRYFTNLTASDKENGIYYGTAIDQITGKLSDGKEWSIKTTELNLASAVAGNIGVQLNESQLALGVGTGTGTYYQAGPVIVGNDGTHYEPHNLQVCVDGSTQTWKVLAYAP